MKHDQRGALNVWWCVMLVGIVTALAFAGLFSVSSGRNLFAEGWAYVQSTPLAAAMAHSQATASAALKGQDAVLSTCKIDGHVVYSNVDCRSDNKTTRVVDVHISHGIEAQKMPVVVAPVAGPADNLQQKALDKAIENQAQ